MDTSITFTGVSLLFVSTNTSSPTDMSSANLKETMPFTKYGSGKSHEGIEKEYDISQRSE